AREQGDGAFGVIDTPLGGEVLASRQKPAPYRRSQIQEGDDRRRRYEACRRRSKSFRTLPGACVRRASDGINVGAGCRSDAEATMIGLPRGVEVYLFGEPCDMRRSFNTLTLIVEQKLGKTLTEGDLFVFVSGDRKRCKVL